jgi:hypothetical protein
MSDLAGSLKMSFVQRALWLLLIAPECLGVQLFNSTSAVPSSIPADCATALTQHITCSQLVSVATISNQHFIDESTLTQLCTETYSPSLLSFQKSVESVCGCTSYTSDISRNQTISSVVDPPIWTYNVSCLFCGSTFCYPAVLDS